MSVARANLVAVVWLPLAALLTLGPFVIRWGAAPLSAAVPGPGALPLVLFLLLASVLLHEAAHAAGFLLLGRAPGSAVRLGFHRRSLTPYAACAAPIAARAYRATALLPAVALGLLPAAVAAATGWGRLALWSWAMVAVAGGDVAAVWAIRQVPARAAVLDHPSRVGCRVLGPG
jgi:hypothetical protein